VVLSDRALRQLARVRDARRVFIRANSREPSVSELAAESQLTLEQLHRLSVADRRPRGLEEPLDEDGTGGATFGDSVRDPRAEEAYDELALRMAAEEIPRLLTHLSERERRVIDARYGLRGTESTLRELGEELGISAERTRQIEQTALETMRVACELGDRSSGPENEALAS
jgi:RNA polymerase primary sigma factor